MRYQKEIFVEQYPLVGSFTKHLVCHRVIRSNLVNLRQVTSFWNDTSTAHLLQASISWCMLFGSDGQNETHWKKLDLGDGNVEAHFRQRLLEALSLSQEQWKSYWEEMVDFRNNYSAHRALRFERPVPVFDLALEIAFFYDSWVRDVIQPDVLDEPPLKQLVDDFQKKVEEEVRCAMTATSALLPRHVGPAFSGR